MNEPEKYDSPTQPKQDDSSEAAKKWKQARSVNAETAPADLAGAFQKMMKNTDMFFQLLDLFPYMIEVFAPDGTVVFLNRAGCEEGNLADVTQVIGHYNILKDPVVLDTLGQREIIEKAFNGERINSYDVRIPYEDTAERYTQTDDSFNKILYQTISCFPLWDDQQQLAYVAMVFITTQTYTGRADIIKAKEYIDRYCTDDFDRDKIAGAIHISPNHFSSLFKEHTGESPQDYYKRAKVRKLQEKLLDPNLNIEQAFAACGVDYHGNYRRYFKEITGQSPSQYKEEKTRTTV